jgi:predicted Zn-dependent protease
MNTLHQSRLHRLAACALVLACAFTPGWIAAENNLPSLGDTERETLSPVLERKLGEEIMLSIRRDPSYLDDGPVLEYLDRFGNGLVSAYPGARGEANYEYNFFAVRDPALNAFALPGGFIAVHSGLVIAAQSESELASVVAHEIGHVAQRHIARGLGQQKQDALIPLASLLLAVLASRAGGDAAVAFLQGGQGLAIQRQLSFSRDLEREADRVGFQILRDAQYDTSGMVAFFSRLQSGGRGFNDNAPSFFRSHPLTTERIADIQGRVREERYKQRLDSLDFHLIRARLRILQDSSAKGLTEAAEFFEIQILQRNKLITAGAKYGLAFIALQRGEFAKARSLLQEAQNSVAGGDQNSLIASLGLEIKLAPGQSNEVVQKTVQDAQAAQRQFPLSRSIAQQVADALIAAGRSAEASVYLRDQIQLYRQEPKLHQQLAQTYALQGKLALQHMSLAESYFLLGSTTASLEQLGLARRAGDASFFDLSVIDARENELKARRKEELKDARR